MTTRKTATPKAAEPAKVSTREGLEVVIEQAAHKAGTITVVAALPGTAANTKGVTDKIRRMPRVKGWNALAVKVLEESKTSVLVEITCAGEASTPWPQKAASKAPAATAAPKAAAKGSKAPKAPAKAAKAAQPRKAAAAKSTARQLNEKLRRNS